jgi:P4 family phage/plasmid primase-like protien
MNGSTTDSFSFAVTEIQTILAGGAPSSHPLAMFGKYSVAVEPMREAYESPETLASAWQYVADLNQVADLVLAIYQGWNTHPDRRLLSFNEVIQELSITSRDSGHGVPGLEQQLMNYQLDVVEFTPAEFLQLRVTASSLGVSAAFLDRYEKVIKGLRTPAPSQTAPAGVPPGGGAASSAVAPPIPTYHLTDLGNAKRLVSEHGRDLRYVHKWNQWRIWNGIRWAEDETGESERRAKQSVLNIYKDAANVLDDTTRNAMIGWAHQSESVGRINAMIDLARSEPGIPIVHDEFDQQKMLLNCRNGTLDLISGQIRAHKRADLITHCCDVIYDPDVECPLWESFLDRIMAGNQALIGFLQRAIGYSLTGITSEHCFFFMFGNGRNGKSTFIGTIMKLLGSYAQKAPTDMLMLKTNQSPIPNDIARLPGARLVVTAEIEARQRFDESRVKDLTGGDKIAARFMRGEFWEFRPLLKLWIYGNHQPRISGTNAGIWSRVRLIPFTVHLLPHERMKSLDEVLWLESSGILNWAIQGCLEWQKSGLGIVDEIEAATAQYREEMDLVASYIHDRVVSELLERIAIKDIYHDYSLWCIENNEHTLTQKQFSTRMQERGYVKERGSGGTWMLRGLRLRRDDEEIDDGNSP